MTRTRLAALVGVGLVTACSKPSPVREPTPAATTSPPAGSDTPRAPSLEPASPPATTTEAVALTCQTATQPRAPGVCGIFEKAPRAEGPAVTKVLELWKRLEGPFRALSGRETALVVLGPDARLGDGDSAKPIPPAAYICPGAPPTVYVPGSLLALIDNADRAKYPDDFLAFVIGHELGHRMNDITPDGCQLAAFQRPGKGVREEELADTRSAFFITSAGFSASRIAKDDMVSRFLEAEYALGREESKGRRDALLGALGTFDTYEALYQAALSVALTGEMEAADRLLTWADELVQSHGVLLPELRVVRAITRINRAAEMAPWGADLGMPVGIESLRCTALHPGHSGLYEEPDRRVRGPDIERGRKLLREALVLLGEAEARGATPFTVAAARACANVYLADATAAAQEQARAEALVPTSAPEAVKRVLADNRALVSFVSHVRKKPPPAIDSGDPLRLWTDELEAALGGARSRAGLDVVLSALRNPDGPPAAVTSSGPACSGPRPAAPAPLPALPKVTGHAQCPTGTSLAYALPPADAQTGSKQGLTVCRPAQGDGELVSIRLSATTEPPLAALERTMRTSRPPAALTTVESWACHCASIERQGVSDRGEVAYRVRCPSLGVERGVILVTGARVGAVIHHSR